MVVTFNREWSLDGVIEEEKNLISGWGRQQRWSLSGSTTDTNDIWNEFYGDALYPVISDGFRYGVTFFVEVRPLEGEYEDSNVRKGGTEITHSGWIYEDDKGELSIRKAATSPAVSLTNAWNNLLNVALDTANRDGKAVNLLMRIKLDLQDKDGNSTKELINKYG